MTSSAARRGWLGLLLSLSAGCPVPPPPDPPGVDCNAIDRPEERFPEECGDAGADDAAAEPESGVAARFR